MRKSEHTGSVYLPAGGEEIALRYTWAGVSELRGTYGGDEWEAEVNRICTTLDAEGLAQLLAIASDKPASWWMEQSPPFFVAAQAVQQALTLAFFGAGGADEKNPQKGRQSEIPAAPASKRGASSAGGRAISGD